MDLVLEGEVVLRGARLKDLCLIEHVMVKAKDTLTLLKRRSDSCCLGGRHSWLSVSV